MNYLDTVMSEEQQRNICVCWLGPMSITDINRVAKAQAKLSYEARDKEIEQARQEGRREVVEWIELHRDDVNTLQRIAIVEKGMKLPKTISNKQMAEAFGGYDFNTKDMKKVCKAEQRNMVSQGWVKEVKPVTYVDKLSGKEYTRVIDTRKIGEG
jgi:hypothetical protein